MEQIVGTVPVGNRFSGCPISHYLEPKLQRWLRAYSSLRSRWIGRIKRALSIIILPDLREAFCRRRLPLRVSNLAGDQRMRKRIHFTGSWTAQTWISKTETSNGISGTWYSLRLAWRKVGKEQSVLRSVPRPMVDLGEKDKPDNSLRKRGNKTRTRQLEKIGNLRIEELNSSKELSEIFDEIENFSHLRLSAIHNVQSKIDKNRKQFHIDLMEETDVV